MGLTENIKVTAGIALIVNSFFLMRGLILSPFDAFTDLQKFIAGVVMLSIVVWLWKIDLKKRLK